MKRAGLTAQRYSDPRDMFRGRLMIPLQDAQGKVIGFTARLLEDNPNAPKYINTPQTVLYDKSRHVYGLHLAKEVIRKGSYAVITEGNLDVIASHQAGVRQVVATAGTALTEQHLKALNRFTGDIRLCFDQDKAGLAATERAIPIASKVGVSLSIIDIPSGKDPDELIKQDASIWQKIIEEPKYALDWLIDRYSEQLDITSAQGKKQFSDILLPVVRQLQDAVEQDHYLASISAMIGVSQDALEQKAVGFAARDRTTKKPTRELVPVNPLTAELAKSQQHFLALILIQAALREYSANLKPEMMSGDEAVTLLSYLQAHPDFNVRDLPKTGYLRPLSEYCKILVLEYEELYQGLDVVDLLNEATYLRTRLIEQYVKRTKHEITQKLGDADDQTTQELLGTARELDTLLKQVKQS
jgi:DNA primase